MNFTKLWPSPVLFIAVTVSSLAAAQVSEWGRVEQLTPGERVKVMSSDHKTHSGEFQSATDSAMVVRTGGGDETFSRDDVHRVLLKRKGHRVRNALIGGGIGAGAGLATGAEVDKNNSFFRNGGKEILTPAFAVIGALIGAALPSGGWTDIYRK